MLQTRSFLTMFSSACEMHMHALHGQQAASLARVHELSPEQMYPQAVARPLSYRLVVWLCSQTLPPEKLELGQP
jgi:hypothetical protein